MMMSGETVLKCIKISYEWTIKEYDSNLIHFDEDECYKSPVFYAEPYSLPFGWRLLAYPMGFGENSNELYLILQRVLTLRAAATSSDDTSVKYTFELVNSKAEKSVKYESSYIFSNEEGNDSYGYGILPKSKVMNESYGFLQDGKIVIRCDLEYMESVNASIVEIHHEIHNDAGCFSNDFSRFLESPKLSDVVLKSSDGKKINAHKIVLSARSPVFAAMFDNDDVLENTENFVDMKNIEYDVLKEFVHFLYSGKTLDLKNTKGLFAAANMYQVQPLQLECERVFCSELTVESACDLLVLTDLYNSKELKEKIIGFVVNNACAISGTIGWLSIAQNQPHLTAELFKALAEKCNQ